MIRQQLQNRRPTRLTLRSDTWNPSKIQEGGRDEELGVMLESVEVSGRSQPGRYAIVEALPPPPYYPQPRWYYDPGTHHPADLWPIYMAETGMGRKAMAALGLPFMLLGVTAIALGWRGLRGGRPAAVRESRSHVAETQNTRVPLP
jgi:hypothetical protein